MELEDMPDRSRAKIAVLVHRHASWNEATYVMRAVCEAWTRLGHAVEIYRDPDRPPQADLGILHVDATVTPPRFAEAIRRFPRSINASCLDISKRTISAQLVRRGDGYPGPVIVKTNLNHGGVPDRTLASKGSIPRRAIGRMRDALPWSCRSRLLLKDYRVYSRANDVPRMVWMNPDLVVERLVVERAGEAFSLRTWVFLGSREYTLRYLGSQPIIRRGSLLGIEACEPPPESLRTRRAELGLDFAKFDYVMHEGQAILFDVNRTPTLSQGPLGSEKLARIDELAKALGEFLP